MSEAKHWISQMSDWQPETAKYRYEVVDTNTGENIASLLFEEDSKLIAAAPELLKALRECVKLLDKFGIYAKAKLEAKELLKRLDGCESEPSTI